MAYFHRCQNCGYETEISNALTAFEENPHCRQCGLSVSESDTKMQDDLINMMSRQMQLNAVQPSNDGSMPPTPQVSPQAAPVTYITQHYHHSSHQASSPESQVSGSLEAAGINAAVLLPSQITLYKNADLEQKQRLIELWRIAPPKPGNQMLPGDMTSWPQTNMEKEEEAATYRWESERERLKNLSALPGWGERNHVEPYIVSGYNAIAPTDHQGSGQDQGEDRRCKDPVYNNREWWNLDDQPMEHQYGLLQQMRYGGAEENWHVSPARREEEDEEML